jgi:hypothetical protein
MLHLVDGIVATGEYAFHGGAKNDDDVVVGSDSDRESSVAVEASQSAARQSIGFGGTSSQNTLPTDTDTDNVCLICSSLSRN